MCVWPGRGSSKFAMRQLADNSRHMPPSPFGIPKGVGVAQHSRPGISPGLQLHVHQGLTGPHNLDYEVSACRSTDPPGLRQLQALRSAQAVSLLTTHPLTHTLVQTCYLCVCNTVGRHRQSGGGQCVAALAAHEYSGCKLLQLFLSSNQGKLLSLLPLPPHLLILCSESANLTSPLMKDDYPAAKEGGGGEEDTREMVEKRMKVKEDEGTDSLFAA